MSVNLPTEQRYLDEAISLFLDIIPRKEAQGRSKPSQLNGIFVRRASDGLKRWFKDSYPDGQLVDFFVDNELYFRYDENTGLVSLRQTVGLPGVEADKTSLPRKTEQVDQTLLHTSAPAKVKNLEGSKLVKSDQYGYPHLRPQGTVVPRYQPIKYPTKKATTRKCTDSQSTMKEDRELVFDRPGLTFARRAAKRTETPTKAMVPDKSVPAIDKATINVEHKLLSGQEVSKWLLDNAEALAIEMADMFERCINKGKPDPPTVSTESGTQSISTGPIYAYASAKPKRN